MSEVIKNHEEVTDTDSWLAEMADVLSFEEKEKKEEVSAGQPENLAEGSPENPTVSTELESDVLEFQQQFDELYKIISHSLRRLELIQEYNPSLADQMIADNPSEKTPADFDKEILEVVKQEYEEIKQHPEQYSLEDVDSAIKEYQKVLLAQEDVQHAPQVTEELETFTLEHFKDFKQLVARNWDRLQTDPVRAQEAERMAEQIINLEMKREIYTHVDLDRVGEVVKDKLRSIDMHIVRYLENNYETSLEAGDAEAVEFFSELYELDEVPGIKYFDPNDESKAQVYGEFNHWDGCVYLRPAKRGESYLGVVGHECFHAWQQQESDKGGEHMDILRGVNLMRYIPAQLDYTSYHNQLVELEAHVVSYTIDQLNYLAQRAEQEGNPEILPQNYRAMEELLDNTVDSIVEKISALRKAESNESQTND